MINFSIPRFSLPHKNLHSAQSSFGKFIKVFRISLLSLLLLILSISSINPNLPVFASHTTLLFNTNGSSIPQIINAIPGGPPFTVKLVVANFDAVNGLGTFRASIDYNTDFFWIPASNGPAGYPFQGSVTTGPFLGSTGKEVSCMNPYITNVPNTVEYYRLNLMCSALGSAPGASVTGTIVNIIFTPTSLQYGPYYGEAVPIDITASSFANVSDNPELVTHTQIDGLVRFAKCANLDGQPAVSVSDIARMVQLFGTTSSSPNWNPNADLNFDNAVAIQDIAIIVKEFGRICPS